MVLRNLLAARNVPVAWSYQTARAVEAGMLKRVLRKFEPAPIPVHMIHTGQKPLPLKLRTFLDCAASRLRESLRG
jgi:DNA-binding transcriptional LysR family regulator